MKFVTALRAAFAVVRFSDIAQSKDSPSACSGPRHQMHRDMMKGAKEPMSIKPNDEVDQDFVRMKPTTTRPACDGA